MELTGDENVILGEVGLPAADNLKRSGDVAEDGKVDSKKKRYSFQEKTSSYANRLKLSLDSFRLKQTDKNDAVVIIIHNYVVF